MQLLGCLNQTLIFESLFAAPRPCFFTLGERVARQVLELV